MNENQKIFIFKLNDYDWFAGANLEDCKQLAVSDYDYEEDTFENPYQVSEENLEKLFLVENNDDYDVDDDTKTFREKLNEMIAKGEEFPCFFASTEY